MKKYTFKLNNNNNTRINNTFRTKSTDYSKILDDLIFDDIIANNTWLETKKNEEKFIDNLIAESYKYTTTPIIDDAFNKAADFLANYHKGTFIPYKKDKTYELSDGTIITISDDYIHINDRMYFFNLFESPSFIATLTPKEKKTICTIYTDGLKITIKK